MSSFDFAKLGNSIKNGVSDFTSNLTGAVEDALKTFDLRTYQTVLMRHLVAMNQLQLVLRNQLTEIGVLD
jgi:hypothetical protein